MDPAMILGPYGLVVALAIAVVHLYRENTRLRDASMDLLKTYQDRDAEELRARREDDRRRQGEGRA